LVRVDRRADLFSAIVSSVALLAIAVHTILLFVGIAFGVGISGSSLRVAVVSLVSTIVLSVAVHFAHSRRQPLERRRIDRRLWFVLFCVVSASIAALMLVRLDLTTPVVDESRVNPLVHALVMMAHSLAALNSGRFGWAVASR
jgi:hypothetical protein